jgi:hypothetical protein
MQITRVVTAAIVSLFALAACSRTEPAAAHDSTTAGPAGEASAATATTGGAKPDRVATVTATGYGPLRIGMTVANAASALNSPVPSMAGMDTACAYARIANAPPGMRVMIAGGTVARVEIDSSTVATGLGVRVGDPESHVRDLYGSRVTVSPHKYLPNGHYMVVAPVPPTDSAFRLIFETDGNRVTKYRAGRLPEVEWVEGCA